MNPTTIVPGLPPANATYSQVSILGDLVFVSGQIGIDPATGRLADGGIQAQTRHAIENIDRCLAEAGTSLDKVAKVNLYLADFGINSATDAGRTLANQDFEMPHNGWGGPRPNSGRKPMKVEHELLLRATQPERFAQLEEAGDLDALTVMRANMEFFHVRAAEILATIIAMPLGDDVNADQLARPQGHGGHHQDAASWPSSAPATSPATRTPRWRQSPPARLQSPGIATGRKRRSSASHAQGVSDAFARIAAGFPPEPRKRCSAGGVVVGRSAHSLRPRRTGGCRRSPSASPLSAGSCSVVRHAL